MTTCGRPATGLSSPSVTRGIRCRPPRMISREIASSRPSGRARAGRSPRGGVACAAETLSSSSPRPNSSTDVPPDYVTRLMTVEEYEQMVLGSEDAMAVIMLKAKSCRPCRAFMKTYYRVAEENKERVNFYELYGDETKETVKLMLKLNIKSTPHFRFYKGGVEVHQHSGISEETLVQHIEEHA